MSDATVVIEEGQRLSRSLLWRLQRSFFARAGMSAWGSATVPHYITCNAFIADAYARVALGYLLDSAERIDLSQPVHVVELGAGSGRFAYLFLKKFQTLLAKSPLSGVPFKYVMTDFTDDAIASWRAHSQLAPLVEAGLLDFARYDVERDETLTLAHAGEVIGPGGLKNPMIVLANYYFDSIPQDIFYVYEKQLYESRVKLMSTQEEPDLDDPEVIQRIDLSYEDVLLEHHDYYEDAEFNRILADYHARLEDTAIRFPVAGLVCCRALRRLASDRWLLVSGDKGTSRAEALEGLKRPGITVHGSFSMNVNYHAIGQYFKNAGGIALEPDHVHNSLNVVAFAMGDHAYDHVETRAAYTASIEAFGPDDFFIIRKLLEDQAEELTLDQAMALIRLGHDDPRMVRQLLQCLRKHGPKSGATTKRELIELVHRAWDLYFHIGEEQDFPFGAGVLLFELGAFEAAIALFHASNDWYGVDAGTAYNLALAHYRMRRLDESLRWAREAVAAEPGHVPAKRLVEDLEAQLSPEPS
jgi:hypothetical protein